MSDKIKAVIVSNPAVHSWFTENYENWDTQVPVWNDACESDPTLALDLMWDYLQDGTLDAQNTQIVILSDELYDIRDGGIKLIDTMAAFAPAAFLGFIITEGNESAAGVIVEHATAKIPAEKQAQAQIYTIPTGAGSRRYIDEALNHYAALVENNFEEPHEEVVEESQVDIPEGITGRVGNVDVSHQGIIIASTSSKGGSGKSTVGFLLASQIAQSSRKAYEQGLTDRPLKVAVVDLDTRDGQLGFLIGVQSPTALNVRLAPSWGPEAIWNNMVYDDTSGIYALLAPKMARTATDVTPEFYQEVFNNLRFMFDYIILDSSVNFMDSLLYDVALPSSELVLFVTTLDQRSVFGMSRWFMETTQPDNTGFVPVERAKVAIVVNESIPNVGIGEKQVRSAAMGAPIAAAVPARPRQEFLSLVNKSRLSDILQAPDIGTVYERLARKIVDKNVPLVSLLDGQLIGAPSNVATQNTTTANNAPNPGKKSLFKRGGRG